MEIRIHKKGEVIHCFGIDKFPERKGTCLYLYKDNAITPMAYFKKETHAEIFKEIMRDFISIANKESENQQKVNKEV